MSALCSTLCEHCCVLVFFKQKTAYEMRISDWSSDVCTSDLDDQVAALVRHRVQDRVADRYVLDRDILDFGANVVPGQMGADRAQIGRASCRERVCQYV